MRRAARTARTHRPPRPFPPCAGAIDGPGLGAGDRAPPDLRPGMRKSPPFPFLFSHLPPQPDGGKDFLGDVGDGGLALEGVGVEVAHGGLVWARVGVAGVVWCGVVWCGGRAWTAAAHATGSRGVCSWARGERRAGPRIRPTKKRKKKTDGRPQRGVRRHRRVPGPGRRHRGRARPAGPGLPRAGDDAGRAVARRLLGAGDPHALDGGQPLAGLVLALSGQSGQRGAAAWAGLGVRGDDLTGGLVSLGVWPRGWAVPAGEVATLPPRTLTNVVWAPPSVPGSWVFVTENPSVLSAAASSSVAGRAHVLCTYGTVSALEAGAVGRLVAAGWQIAVRADFDAAGLGIVRALRQAAPTAVTWRMDADAYELGASRGGGLPLPAEVTDCWDQDLLEVMHARGLAVFEESLLPELLADLDVGVPRSDTADVR